MDEFHPFLVLVYSLFVYFSKYRYNEQMKRLTVDLPDELHTRLKVQTAMTGKDMSEVVRKLIADYLKKVEGQAKP